MKQISYDDVKRAASHGVELADNRTLKLLDQHYNTLRAFTDDLVSICESREDCAVVKMQLGGKEYSFGVTIREHGKHKGKLVVLLAGQNEVAELEPSAPANTRT